MSKLITRTAEMIAGEINDIKNQTRALVLYNSIEIGRKLVEAKELVSHGEWGKWLEEKVDYSKTTANNLMKIFKEYGAEQISLLNDRNVKSEIYEKLNYSQAVELLGVPGEIREQFIKENSVEELSTRELKDKIKQLKNALKDVNESKKNLEKQIKESNKEKDNLSNVVLELNKQLEKHNSETNVIVEDLEERLKVANGKIKELEERPVEVNVGLSDKEKEEVEALKEEITTLRREIDKNKTISNRNNESVIKFSMCINDISDKFNELLNIIELETDKDLKDKLSNAINAALDRMKENV